MTMQLESSVVQSDKHLSPHGGSGETSLQDASQVESKVKSSSKTCSEGGAGYGLGINDEGLDLVDTDGVRRVLPKVYSSPPRDRAAEYEECVWGDDCVPESSSEKEQLNIVPPPEDNMGYVCQGYGMGDCLGVEIVDVDEGRRIHPKPLNGASEKEMQSSDKEKGYVEGDKKILEAAAFSPSLAEAEEEEWASQCRGGDVFDE